MRNFKKARFFLGKGFFLKVCMVSGLLLSCLFAELCAQKSNKIERLEKLLELNKNDSTRINILIALHDEYIKTSPLKAKTFVDEALKTSEKINHTAGIIQSSDNIGNIYHNQGAFSQAIKYFERALALKERNKDRLGIADSYNKLGNSYILDDNFEKGIDFYKKAIFIRESSRDTKGLATLYTNLGGAYYRFGDNPQSIAYHLKALALADTLKDRQVLGYNLNRLAETYFKQKNYRDAMKCYRQLLHLAQRTGSKLEIQKAYQGLSQIYAEQDDYKKAYEYYQFYAIAKESLFKDLQNQAKQDIEDTQTELSESRRRQELQNAVIAQQTTLNYSIMAAFGFILVITFILFRNNRQRLKTNRFLEQQKKEIELKSSELEQQKDKIEHQSEAISKKNETLEATFKEIERKNKDITASINYAKRIQESILPLESQMAAALPQHFVFFRPRDIVSGDFYWLSEKNGKTILAAFDCTGHGVPGAIMSMLGDSYLNQIIYLQGITSPDLVLNELHNNINTALKQEETKNQDGMDVALCVIDKEKKTLEFAGASRVLYIIQSGEAQSIESCKLPVGGFQKERERIFIKYECKIDIPTVFYIFSDGFQDQFGGPRGRKFAKSRLEETLFENHQKPMSEQKVLLEKTLVDWMGDNRQMDDIMVIGVQL